MRYLRQEGGFWLFSEASGNDAAVELPTIGCTLSLRDVYDKVPRNHALPESTTGG